MAIVMTCDRCGARVDAAQNPAIVQQALAVFGGNPEHYTGEAPHTCMECWQELRDLFETWLKGNGHGKEDNQGKG